MPPETAPSKALESFDPAVIEWFTSSFESPTAAQSLGWPAIARGESTLIFAPTGSGKTLTAFLWCINRLMFSPVPDRESRCRAIYISPLKALAVDVERNLRAPIAGISNVAARSGRPFHSPLIGVRTGDTPQSDRARFQRDPSDILITTPESLYLLLTSRSREVLRHVETVIIDEIHALVPSKRGSHLALSIERLEYLCQKTPQRIGLSATQHPLEEVARFLGGIDARHATAVLPAKAMRRKKSDPDKAEQENESAPPLSNFRPVTIIDTRERKRLDLRVEVPVEDMASLGEPEAIPSGPASAGVVRSSIWPAIHPRLLELIHAHRSTLIFVNSRRLAERLAAALNELAGETLVAAHHGSISRAQRVEIEDNLKSGRLPGLIATSSLELGIDMGAIDLVIQIEAPPSIASGMQRIGRASHQVNTVSKGIIFPKYRGDLVACAAITEAMRNGQIEPTRYPRNPLDVLAQQVVAMVAMDDWDVDEIFLVLRSAAPFGELSRPMFENVLDMLSGVYPSDEFAELRPRLTWDRIENRLTARPGSKRVAVINGGTIPDRGLYGVFMAGAEKTGARVGELDEEMVFESRVGETFLLGASTWRIEEITHDRIVVSPAPGQPGKMPFWHGDSADRSVVFGERIGLLIREIQALPRAAAIKRLVDKHDLEEGAALNLVQYLDEQREATRIVPSDRDIVIERCTDELGDWRVCVLTPFGGKVHAPWAMAVTAKIRHELAIDVEAMWSDDGFIIRFPETDEPPDTALVVPSPEEAEALVVEQLGGSALFAAKFREAAARALLLPRRRAGARTPLWQQRKRASDLLHVAAQFGSFPMLLEAYRECLRDVFDVPALVQTLGRMQRREISVSTVDTDTPSPFASALLFRYIANYIYDGDAPLAERRAQALSIDQSQLRELLGDAQLRELLDADAIAGVERQLQALDPRYQARNADAIHDLLLRIGDLTREEIAARSQGLDAGEALTFLTRARRVVSLSIAGETRIAAVEDSGRYRDALGTPTPPGIPDRFLEPVKDPAGDLILRFARTHGPFTTGDVARRFGLGEKTVEPFLARLAHRGRILEGEFTPSGTQREWCESESLQHIRRRSLAKLRKEVEPVEPRVAARLVTAWQGVSRKRKGLDALLETIETLQGCPLAASILESEILPARIEGYRPSQLDTLTAAGEVVWAGVESLGERDGRIALYLTDHFPILHRPAPGEATGSRESSILEFLTQNGASFFPAIHAAAGGFPAETVTALWNLVWQGRIMNDSFHPLRAFARPRSAKTSRATSGRAFRSRRASPPSSEGRWSVPGYGSGKGVPERRAAALSQQLLARYGLVTREVMNVEGIPGGFSAVYDTLKLMEEGGRIRRGYFVEGVAANQFATPAALDLLRSLRTEPDTPETILLASTDPANPYGNVLAWSPLASGRSPSRAVGASVILVNGALAAYLGRGEKQVQIYLPEDEPARTTTAREIAGALAQMVETGRRRAVLLGEVNGAAVSEHPISRFLLDRGFISTSMGFHLRAERFGKGAVREPGTEE